MTISVIRLWLDSYPWFSQQTRLWLDSFESLSSQIWLTTHESSTTLVPTARSSSTSRNFSQWAARPGRIFPNSITRVVPASGWPSDWLSLANQRRKTQCGCRGLGSVMCSYCQTHTEDVVADQRCLGKRYVMCIYCQSLRTEDMAEWCVGIRPRSVSHLAPFFFNLCVKRYRENEHDEAIT